MKLSLITATHHRADLLASSALPSVVGQTSNDFEWIVINDGGDPATRQLINTLDTPFRWVYQEITHSSQGFGLCHARNVGLELASGELVAYLDDDNSLQPHFVAAMIEVFETQRSTRCCLPQQWRRRDVLKHGEVIRSGTPFISPSDRCTVKALIQQQELFDSNRHFHNTIEV
jgi:glycosyltransferase involved in cell wall biosynthesis